MISHNLLQGISNPLIGHSSTANVYSLLFDHLTLLHTSLTILPAIPCPQVFSCVFDHAMVENFDLNIATAMNVPAAN